MPIYLTTALALTLLIATPAPNATNATPAPYEQVLSVTEPDALDLWIESLAFQESSGREDVEIIDTNGEWSRGCLQFQDRTLRYYAAKYDLHGEALDCRYQKALTRQILLGHPDGWRNWYTSVNKLGKPPA
jgi:hypothetical protein